MNQRELKRQQRLDEFKRFCALPKAEQRAHYVQHIADMVTLRAKLTAGFNKQRDKFISLTNPTVFQAQVFTKLERGYRQTIGRINGFIRETEMIIRLMDKEDSDPNESRIQE